jgi:hypothetical protein
MTLFCCGCYRELSTPEKLPLVIQGDEASKRELEDIIRAHPDVIYPNGGIKYHLQIVKPDPSIDYKILQVKPDPSMHYTIIIIDPQTKRVIPNLTEEIGRDISKLLQQKRERE